MAWYDGALQPDAPAGDLPFPGSPAWFAWQQQQFQNGYAPGYGATSLPVYAPAAQATAPPVPLAPPVNPYVPPPAPAPPPLAYGGFGANPPLATMPYTLTTNPDGTIDYKQGDRTFHMDPNKFDPTGMYGNASDPPQERRGTFPTKPPGAPASSPGGPVPEPIGGPPPVERPYDPTTGRVGPNVPGPNDGTVGSPGFLSPPGGAFDDPYRNWTTEPVRPVTPYAPQPGDAEQGPPTGARVAPARPWYAFAGGGNQQDWGQTGLTNLSQDQQLFYDVNPSLVNRAVETYANADPLSHFRQYTQAQMPGIEQDFARWAVGPNAGAHYSDYVQQRYNDTARGFAGLSASQRGENPLAFGGGAGTAPGRMVFR